MTMNTKAAMLDVMDMFDGTISLDVAMENATETLPVKGVMFVSCCRPHAHTYSCTAHNCSIELLLYTVDFGTECVMLWPA